VAGQIGLERTPAEFVSEMVNLFRLVREAMRDDGTLWLNLGDSYAGGGNYRGTDEATLTTKQRSNRGAHGELAVGRTGELPPTLSIVKSGILKAKDLIGIPWRVALALQADGWYLRSDIIWHKPNPMPESVTDRPTKSHEYVFLLTKAERYYYDADAIREEYTMSSWTAEADAAGISQRGANGFRVDGQKMKGHPGQHTGMGASAYSHGGRNARSVWTINTAPYPEAHFATFPEALPERCIKAGSKEGDTVLDPFCGSGTTGAVSMRLGRNFVGIELNPAYAELSRKRIGSALPMFSQEVPA
jgi:hypothetical protein